MRSTYLYFFLILLIGCDIPEFEEDNPFDPHNPDYVAPSVTINSGPSENETITDPSTAFSWVGNTEGMTFRYFFDGFLKKQQNPNQIINAYTDSENFNEVRLQRNREGHYLSSGTINNTTVIFLLDTGATNVVIPFHIAENIGLKTGHKTHSVTANGTVSTYATRLDRISIGAIEIREVGASINPNTDEDVILLGMTFLKHLEFTQRGDTLTLRQYLE